MPQPGLVFSTDAPRSTRLTSRADVAVFAGLVPRRAGVPVPDGVRQWLQQAGWANAPLSRPATARPDSQIDSLLDVPVPLDRWDDFDALFAWEQRLVQAGRSTTLPCSLGAAVRAFFAEGGRRCYVVRCGDPPPLLAAVDSRMARMLLLAWPPAQPPADAPLRCPILPGLAGRGVPASAADPTTWHGAAHVLGIDEAAMLLLPDMADLLAPDPLPLPPPPPPPLVPELFVTCAPAADPGLADEIPPLPVAAPRMDVVGYGDWATAVRFALAMMAAPGAAARRDVVLLAGLPLPLGGAAAGAVAPDPQSETWPLALFDEADIIGPGQSIGDAGLLGSARLQLGYPWVATDLSAMPEGVQSPEGTLAGAIARSTLLAGAHASAAGARLASVRAVLPELARADIMRGLPGGRADWLGDRISLVGPRSDGFVLLSDATMATDPAWRAASVVRLVGVVVRAARELGQTLLFESSGEALWARTRQSLRAYLQMLWDLGALDGATPADAFAVRCDRSTMSQRDLDAGRLIATVSLTAAQPVQRISVTLALAGGADATLAEAA